jgi:glycosyltransferase involved in cell wall biosynthesis
MLPDVSIVMSIRNPGPYLELALKSIFAQTLTSWELILLDDASNDGSLPWVQSLKDPRVKVRSDGLWRRLHVRRNQGIALANARYVALMDADDIMHPRRLELQVAELERQHRPVVLGSAAFSIDGANNVVGLRRPMPVGFREGYRCRSAFLNPTVAAPTSWFRANPYSEDPVFYRSEDAELWCRTCATTNFVNLQDPLLFYRDAGSLNLNNYLGSAMGLCALLRRRYARPRYEYLRQVSSEIVKAWTAVMADTFGAGDLLVKRRRLPIEPAARQEALQILSRISAIELPLPPAESVGGPSPDPAPHLSL